MGSARDTTLMIVEDEAALREVIGFTLMPLGCKVLEAANGLEALEIAAKTPFDAVLTDLTMPRMGGVKLMNELRLRGFHQPVVVLTGNPSSQSMLQALRMGAFDYLEKPFETEEVVDVVREALQIGKFLREQSTTKPLVDAPAKALMRLMALRYGAALKARPQDSALNQLQARPQEFELPTFVTEAEAQLTFCVASLANLADPSQTSGEAAYLFRVMQAIAEAASAFGLTGMAPVAEAASSLFAHIMIVPRAVDREVVTAGTHAVEFLKQAIEGIERLGAMETEATRLVSECERVLSGRENKTA